MLDKQNAEQKRLFSLHIRQKRIKQVSLKIQRARDIPIFPISKIKTIASQSLRASLASEEKLCTLRYAHQPLRDLLDREESRMKKERKQIQESQHEEHTKNKIPSRFSPHTKYPIPGNAMNGAQPSIQKDHEIKEDTFINDKPQNNNNSNT
jgi:hypothetical protein